METALNMQRRYFVRGALGMVAVSCSSQPPGDKSSQSKGGSPSAPSDPLEMVCDYASSFVTFVGQGRNNMARLQVESRCLLWDENHRLHEEFFQFASCKSEDTYAEQNLFTVPNYDFSGIFSRDNFVIFRARRPEDTRDYAERGAVRERFEDLWLEIRPAPESTILTTNAEIVKATLEGLRLVGRTEIRDERNGHRAILEYPIKTMNVNDQKQIYQVDTGPLVFPDFETQTKPPPGRQDSELRPVATLELAYVAHNRPDRAEFIMQRETAIKAGGKKVRRVCHYSEIRQMAAKNTLLSLRPV